MTESTAPVKARSRGATQIQAESEKTTTAGASSSHGAPYVYACPEKPTKLFVLE